MDLPSVTRATYEKDVLKAEGVTLLYFTAAWCRPGREMLDVVKAAADEVGDKLAWATVDTDQEPDIARLQDVRTIPSILLLKNGTCLARVRGSVTKLNLLTRISTCLVAAGSTQA
jgi:thioredoxin 1